ncbi:DUF2608 domain-containing protein [Aliikangiella sp. IMCC44359]|uniref:DUF2608 domain-containing protein n=1 Tax=Aliikangiella sp. IMCC44359 TaxID=3459125 RepID=UPI00403A9936
MYRLTFILFLTFITSCAQSAKISSPSFLFKETKSLLEVETYADNQKSKKSDTLIVFDIDDTLLLAKNFVGGDVWYLWQSWKKGENPIKDVNGVTHIIKPSEKYRCLYWTIESLTSLATFEPTESDAPKLLNRLQEKFDLMLLTSRSPSVRAATERELKNTKFPNFKKSHLMPEDYALAFDFKIGQRTDSVSYQDGIVMSSGLNKGKVLKEILSRVNKQYKNILFVDDTRKNIDDVANEWKGESETNLAVFYYTKIDKRLHDGDIKVSNNVKAKFENFLREAYPDRYQDFMSERCL